jgi:prepilin-type N-terminal cleavage/methylation domain-containing protein
MPGDLLVTPYQRSSQVINDRGLTLIELLIATAIFSTAMLGIIGMFPVAHQHLRAGRDATQATAMAQQMMEALRGEPLAFLPRYDAADTRMPASFPLDDSHSISPFRGRSLLWRWYESITAAPHMGGLDQGWGRITVASLDRGLTAVTVTVGWQAAAVSRSVQLSTYLGSR